MAKRKIRLKFWKLLSEAFDIVQISIELYEKVLEISKDPALRNLAARLKQKIDNVRKK